MVDHRDILFFIGISIMTIILVQSIIFFIKDQSSLGTKIFVILIEVSIIVTIIKLYDSMSRWEKISKIITNRYPDNPKTTLNTEKKIENSTKYCSQCGYNINVDNMSGTESDSNGIKPKVDINNYPKYCINCGNKI